AVCFRTPLVEGRGENLQRVVSLFHLRLAVVQAPRGFGEVCELLLDVRFVSRESSLSRSQGFLPGSPPRLCRLRGPQTPLDFRSGAQDSLATLQVCFGPVQLSLFRAEFRFAQAELLLFRLGGGQKPSGIFEFSLGRGFAALRLLGRGDLAILPLLPGRRQEL